VHLLSFEEGSSIKYIYIVFCIVLFPLPYLTHQKVLQGECSI